MKISTVYEKNGVKCLVTGGKSNVCQRSMHCNHVSPVAILITAIINDNKDY